MSLGLRGDGVQVVRHKRPGKTGDALSKAFPNTGKDHTASSTGSSAGAGKLCWRHG
jgi:hypothetical protein